MEVGEHEIHTFKVLVVELSLNMLLSFDVFVSTSAHLVIIFGRELCQKMLKCQLNMGFKPLGVT